jgi:hypothetical protein
VANCLNYLENTDTRRAIVEHEHAHASPAGLQRRAPTMPPMARPPPSFPAARPEGPPPRPGSRLRGRQRFFGVVRRRNRRPPAADRPSFRPNNARSAA